MQVLDNGREGDVMPKGYLPAFDYNIWRITGHVME